MDTRTSLRFVAGAALAAAVAFALIGCGGSGTSTVTPTPGTGGTGGSTAAPNTVIEKNKAFDVTSLTVKVGDTVTFANQDTVPHDIVVGTQDLGRQDPGQSVTWSATKDGTYGFKCIIHPSMTGQIVVGAGGSTTPPTGTSGAAPGGSTSAPSGGGY
jgi:plastocyanin